MIKKEIKDLLRSPVELRVLEDSSGSEFQAADGEKYPIIDGILCLLKEEERDTALNEDSFYDDHPFGERDWSNISDLVDGVEEEFKNLLKRFPRLASIIDVGSGTGRISNYLSLKGYENTVSLDYSFHSLKQIKDNSSNVCIWGNNLHLPMASGSFDLVVSTGVIHHTPDPYQSLKECVRILKPGGMLYLRTYNRYSLYCFLYNTYGSLLRLFELAKITRFLTDIFGFRVYKFVRKKFFSLPERDERVLKAKFANLFTKKMVYFFTESEVENLLRENGMVIKESKKSRKIHRMLCYIAEKRA